MATAEIEGVEPLNIYQIIARIKREVGALAPVQSQGVPFPFRGIDGTVNHLNGKINEYGVVTVPTVIKSKVTAREAGSRVVKTAHMRIAYTFYAPDGSEVTAITEGLADDFADRAVAQAQSVAFRIALLQTFFLPTQSPEPEQTGQAVQDDAAAPAQPKAVANAAKAAAPQAQQTTLGGSPSQVEELREKIRVQAAAVEADTGAKVNYAKIGGRLYPKDAGWAGKPAALKAVLKAIEAGEVE